MSILPGDRQQLYRQLFGFPEQLYYWCFGCLIQTAMTRLYQRCVQVITWHIQEGYEGELNRYSTAKFYLDVGTQWQRGRRMGPLSSILERTCTCSKYSVSNRESAMKNERLIFETQGKHIGVQLDGQHETWRLNQREIISVFGTEVPAISKHVCNLLKDKELNAGAIIACQSLSPWGTGFAHRAALSLENGPQPHYRSI